MPHPTHPFRRHRGPNRRRWIHAGIAATALLLCFGCRTRHAIEVEPTHHTVKIEPIYMTVDINIRVQQELDEFYSDVVQGTDAEPEEGGNL